MVIVLLFTVVVSVVFWLVFFRFKWLQFSITWAVVSAFFAAHLLLVFLIGMRFVAPYTTNARMIQHTIQLVPRLSEPTLVTEVLVEPNVHVVKGQVLFQFDRRPYEIQVRNMQATLAAARQAAPILDTQTIAAEQAVSKALAQLEFSRSEQSRYAALVPSGAISVQESQQANSQLAAAEVAVVQAREALKAARDRDAEQIGGVNTAVLQAQAGLDLALFYLENTTLVAPEDGRIVNLQVRPGMVAGDYRAGAIASFICDADRYLLASYFQENLKYVEVGQPVEVALDLYPGQIFPAKVQYIWRASGEGQLLPSGTLPTFNPLPPDAAQTQYAVAIQLDGPDQDRFPIGAQGASAIYTGGGGFAWLRKISIRTYTWLNWLYPAPF